MRITFLFIVFKIASNILQSPQRESQGTRLEETRICCWFNAIHYDYYHNGLLLDILSSRSSSGEFCSLGGVAIFLLSLIQLMFSLLCSWVVYGMLLQIQCVVT